MKSNQVITVRFEQADYSKHLCHLLKEAKLPPREIEDFEIYHIDRRLFNGDTAIQMAADLLNIDIKQNKVYKTTTTTAKDTVLGKRKREETDKPAIDEVVCKPTTTMMYAGINSYAQRFYQSATL